MPSSEDAYIDKLGEKPNVHHQACLTRVTEEDHTFIMHNMEESQKKRKKGTI
jgi:hypothetical protein